MPRGNDSQAAGQELTARTGVAANAEHAIHANAERWPPQLLAANNRRVDDPATDELDDSAVEGLIGKDRYLLGYAVRGPFVVTVSEDERGNALKQAFPLKGKEKQAQRLAPVADPEEADKKAQQELEEQAKDADTSVAEPEGAAQGAAGPGAPAKQ